MPEVRRKSAGASAPQNAAKKSVPLGTVAQTAVKKSTSAVGTPSPKKASAAGQSASAKKPTQTTRSVKPIKTAQTGATVKQTKVSSKASIQASDKVAAKGSVKEAKRRRRLILKIVRRSLLCLLTALLVAVFGVYMVLFTIFNGPSVTVSDLVVKSLLETSALKFVPRMYFSEAEVQQIIARNAVVAPDEATDTSLVVIDRTPKIDEITGEEEKDIEIVEVNGATYHGYMMIVQDPSRVSLAVCDPTFDSRKGKYLDEMAIENGAIAAINAGGFEDEGGTGSGGKPLGIVVKDGKVIHSKTSSACSIVIGFDKNDKLIVGKLNARECEELGMRDAASFDPVLILNGEPASVKGSSSGLNPRTAIGQRADGAVLLLVIDGRQVNSMGASLADLIDVMMQFGAVNAANLDGGSSSNLYYNGEYINDGVALTGSRKIPTGFIVR